MYVQSLEIFQNLKGLRERKARISFHRQNSNKRLTIVACCAVGQPVLLYTERQSLAVARHLFLVDTEKISSLSADGFSLKM